MVMTAINILPYNPKVLPSDWLTAPTSHPAADRAITVPNIKNPAMTKDVAGRQIRFGAGVSGDMAAFFGTYQAIFKNGLGVAIYKICTAFNITIQIIMPA